jgi:hypothetical protein
VMVSHVLCEVRFLGRHIAVLRGEVDHPPCHRKTCRTPCCS